MKAAALLCSLAASASAALPPAATVLADLTSASSYWDSLPANQPSAGNQDCGWERGAYFSGHVELLATTPSAAQKATLLEFGNRWGSVHNWTCGGLWEDANNIACGQGFAGLYDALPEDYKLALSVTLDREVAQWSSSGWGWVDLLFMGLPTMLLYANRTSDVRFHDSALAQYSALTHGGSNTTANPGLWDPASNLYWRDSTYINKRNSDGTKVFWGRGNGWAFAALALAHRALPPTDVARAEIGARLVAMAGALRPLQQADGMWRANLLFPTMPGATNPESTSSG
jgi:rhamnogalacturonyl hydrolase YesR